jgi:signal peptide peptidase SppA
MKRLLLLTALCIGLAGCGTQVAVQPTETKGKLAVLHIEGEIDRFEEAKFKKDVDQIVADPSVSAVLLEVNSPGGGVYESALMYDDLAKITVPVVAYCHQVCASGAVYSMMAPSVVKVYVNRATIIGSIGVFSVRQRSEKPENIDIYKSGKYKLAGALTTKEDGEDAYIQHQIDEMAKTFYDLVAANRGHKISPESWVHIKNAEVFIGKEGVERGLADGVVSVDGIFQVMEQYAHKAYDILDLRHDLPQT